MIRKALSSRPDYIHVIFELPSCIWAAHIFVVGDCNAWNPTATPMHQDRDGVWRTEVDLPYGSVCEFRYLIDGRWLSDNHADDWAENPYGSSNSVVIAVLPEKSLQLERRCSQVWEPTSPGAVQARVKARYAVEASR